MKSTIREWEAFDEVMNLWTYIFCMGNATWTETFYLLDAFLKPNAFPLDAIPPFFKGGNISIRDKSLVLMIVLCYPIPICAFWLITSYSWVKCYGHPRPTQLDVFIVIVVSSPPSATATIWDWCLCENSRSASESCVSMSTNGWELSIGSYNGNIIHGICYYLVVNIIQHASIRVQVKDNTSEITLKMTNNTLQVWIATQAPASWV